MVLHKVVNLGTMMAWGRDWYGPRPAFVFKIQEEKGGRAETEVYPIEPLEELRDELTRYIEGQKAKAEAQRKKNEENLKREALEAEAKKRGGESGVTPMSG